MLYLSQLFILKVMLSYRNPPRSGPTMAIAIMALMYNFAWAQKITPQCNDFDSHFTLTTEQISTAGITNLTVNNVEVALNFERTALAHGLDDDFYTAPENSSTAPAGTLLKLEIDANTTLYTLPPNTALSRIIFQTETLNGTLAPASAYILWPYMPRIHKDGYPVVAFAHGNSGVMGACAPSNFRSLQYMFAAPYPIVLDGYVVVAPDYVGKGVDKYADGSPLYNPILGSPSHANDLFYSVQAAQTAFSSLSKEFVVMGHSEGGGSAWAAAERQAVRPVEGYLGSVAGSPVTDTIAIAKLANGLVDDLAILLVNSILGIWPNFNASEILTPAGEKLWKLLQEIQGCNAVDSEILTGTGLVKTDWLENFYVNAYGKLIKSGGAKIAGPLLVLQGEADNIVPYLQTSVAVNETCSAFGDSTLEYATFANVTHVPVLAAAQRLWLDWIRDRFAGIKIPGGCSAKRYVSARPYQYYQAETSYYLMWADAAYETA